MANTLVGDAQPCLGRNEDVESDGDVGYHFFEYSNKAKSCYGAYFGNRLGKLGFVHEDVAANQVHAEAGEDFLDSHDAACCPTIIKALLLSTRNSASTTI